MITRVSVVASRLRTSGLTSLCYRAAYILTAGWANRIHQIPHRKFRTCLPAISPLSSDLSGGGEEQF